MRPRSQSKGLEIEVFALLGILVVFLAAWKASELPDFSELGGHIPKKLYRHDNTFEAAWFQQRDYVCVTNFDGNYGQQRNVGE